MAGIENILLLAYLSVGCLSCQILVLDSSENETHYHGTLFMDLCCMAESEIIT